MQGKVQAIHTTTKSIKTADLLEFVDIIIRVKTGPVWLLIDNLPLHAVDAFTDKCAAHDIFLVRNGTYSSEFQPIERLWKHAKCRWRKEMLGRRDWSKERPLQTLVKQCCLTVHKAWMRRYWQVCLRRMGDWLRDDEDYNKLTNITDENDSRANQHGGAGAPGS